MLFIIIALIEKFYEQLRKNLRIGVADKGMTLPAEVELKETVCLERNLFEKSLLKSRWERVGPRGGCTHSTEAEESTGHIVWPNEVWADGESYLISVSYGTSGSHESQVIHWRIAELKSKTYNLNYPLYPLHVIDNRGFSKQIFKTLINPQRFFNRTSHSFLLISSFVHPQSHPWKSVVTKF